MSGTKVTPSETPKCPQCGTPLPTGALAGLCPACLLKQGAAAETATGGQAPPFQPPPVAELAPLFPQLEILELIGKGGMGAVYKARQKELDRIVALKILPPGIGDDPAFAERFAREAKALAKLNHPGIVTLYEFGHVLSSAGIPPASGSQRSTLNPQPLYYFLMEFVDGVNLRQLLHAGRIAPREALAIVPQICDALQFAHDQGIVHRDIKPENILLDRRDRVKVADFGLAKIVGSDAERSAGLRHGATPADDPNVPCRRPALQELTDAGKVMGTPNYMAPEQAEHPGEVDHRADIYALGVVFYQMLTGELPGKPIVPPSRTSGIQIDVRLDEVVLRALEKKPELRYQQVSEVKTCVETIAQTPAAGSRPPILEKHHRAPWSQGLVLWSLLLTGLFLRLAFVLFKHGGGSSLLEGSLMVALTLGCALFAIRGYTITADAILIHRLFWATRLPLAGLKSARFEIASTRWSIRAGNGGFFSCTGFRYNRSLGLYRVFVTDGARTVVLRYAHRTVVVSPADPEAFVRDVTASIRQSNAAFDDERKEHQAGKIDPVVGSMPPPPAPRITEKPADQLPTNFGVPAIVFALSYSCFVGYLVYSAQWLPERMASHFGPDFKADDWMPSQEFLFIIGIVPLVLPLLFVGVFAVRRHLTVTTAIETYIFRQILWFACLFTGFFTGIQYLTVQANNTVPPHLAVPPFLFLMIGFLLATVIYAIQLLHRIAGLDSRKHAAQSRENTMNKSLTYGIVIGLLCLATGLAVWFAAQNARNHAAPGGARTSIESPPAANLPGAASAGDVNPQSAGEKAAVAAAQKWLVLIDQGDYSASWKEAAPFFQGAVTETSWETYMASFRKPLGNLLSRKLKSAQHMTELPGAPDGQYVVMQFETSFANKKSAIETVTFMLEKDGRWKSAGYFIK